MGVLRSATAFLFAVVFMGTSLAQPRFQPAPQPLPPQQPARPAQPAQPAAIPAELVGFWQQILASSGDYEDPRTGFRFTATQGFSSELVIHADGSYYMDYFSSGTRHDCNQMITYFEWSVGTLSVAGNRLILQPRQHRVETRDCGGASARDMGTEPIVYQASYVEDFDYYGVRRYELTLEGGHHGLTLTLLHREPAMPGHQPAQPADFVLGEYTIFREFEGTWADTGESDLNFYNPATGAWYIPEWNGSTHEYVRFTEAGYELARAWPDYGWNAGCQKDYVYYERGTTRFELTGLPTYEGDSLSGHLRMQGQDARLIVNIHHCGDYDQVLNYRLIPMTSFYVWDYVAPPTPQQHGTWPETLTLSCPWDRTDWQFMVCDDRSNIFRRRE